MATTTKQALDALIAGVARTDGFQVADLGRRWRITNVTGGIPVFVDKRPPVNNTLKSIHDSLASIGWNEYRADEQRLADRQQRLQADREANEAKLAAAQRAADEAALQQIQQEEERLARSARQQAAAREHAERAIDLGFGYRKEIIEVDADFAKALLEHNNFFVPNRRTDAPVGRCNRPFSTTLRDYYADQMARGVWPLTHQGIALDIEGFLLDGQHRLAALVKAAETNPDVTFRTEITYDLPPETMNYIDQGRRRSPTDILALHNFRNRLVLASATRLLHMYDAGMDMDSSSGFKLPPDQMLAYIQANPGVEDAVARGVLLGRVTVASSASAFIYLAERVYRNAPMTDFLQGLRTGVGLEAGDPRLAFRDLNERIRRRRRLTTDNIEQLAMLIKTWNYWLTDRPLRQMKFRIDEEFPRPIERL